MPKDTKWLEFAEEPVREHFDMQLFSGCRAPPGVGRLFFFKAGIWARSARSCPFPGKTAVAHFYRLINHLFDIIRCLRCGVSFVLCSSRNDANLRSCTDRKVSPATELPMYPASVDLDARLTDDGPPAGIFLPSEPISGGRIHPDRLTAQRS